MKSKENGGAEATKDGQSLKMHVVEALGSGN